MGAWRRVRSAAATLFLVLAVGAACASGEDVEPSSNGGSGNVGGSGGASGDASAGSGGGGASAAGGVGGAGGGAGGSAGQAGGDASSDAAGGSAGSGGSGGSSGGGANETCPGETLTLTGSPTLKATVSAGTPPQNDAQGSCTTVAAREAVYHFVAPVDGVATVLLSTTAFDGVLYVRETCADTATELDCKNTAGTNGTEKAVFYAKAGADYFIFADGASATAAGLFAIQVELAPAQPVDSCPGEVLTWTGSGTQDRTTQASGNTSQLWPNDTAGCATGSSAAPDAVYELTPDVNGILSVEAVPSGWDTVLSLRSDCANAATQIACANNEPSGGKETLEVWATSGSKLYAMVDGPSASGVGAYTFNATLSPEKPNEKCPGETATLTGTSPMTWSVTSDNAKRWPDLTLGCAAGSGTARDAVYALTAPATGALTLKLSPQFWDAVLGVRTTCSSSGAEQCYDAPGPSSVDTASFVATGGVTYYLIVDAKQAAAAGVFTLEASLVPFPPADGCPGQLLTPSGNVAQVSDDLSTFYPDYTASCAQVTAAKDAVYRVVAPKTGTMNVALVPQGFDAALYVQTTCGSAPLLACNDANGTNGGEYAAVPVTQGTTYYVVVDSATSGAGQYTLTLTF